MASERFEDAYVPDVVTDEDLAKFDEAGFGARMGWGDSPAVVVVDMTRQFTSGDYPLGRSDTGEAAVDSIATLLDTARGADLPVYYLRGMDDSHVGSAYAGVKGEKSAGSPFDPGEGNEIRTELEPAEDDVVIQKPRPSAFFDTPLANMLRHAGIDTVVVTGMVTSGCVRGTVVDAFSHNFRVVVPAECSADRGDISHEVSLFDMDMKYADVTPLSDVLDTIDSRFA